MQQQESTIMNRYMKEAIAEAKEGIENGHGGPFGCVIVKDGEIDHVGQYRKGLLRLYDQG